ncbi:MAG: MFS transporter [Thermoplasmataceae archaeon]
MDADRIRLVISGICSVFGSSMLGLAAVWLVFVNTHSALDLAYLGLLELIAGIVFPIPLGTVIDRVRSKMFLGLMLVAAAVSASAIFLTLAVSGFSLLIFLVMVFPFRVFRVISRTAANVITPEIVGESEIARFNGILRGFSTSFSFVAYAVSGIMIYVSGPDTIFLITSVLMTVSGISILTLKKGDKKTGRGRENRRGFLSDSREGFRWLFSNRGIMWISISAVFFNMYFSATASYLVLFNANLPEGTALTFGLLSAFYVMGFSIGGMAVHRLGTERYGGIAWIVFQGLISGIVLVIMSIENSVLLSWLLIGVWGITTGIGGNTWLSSAQKYVPHEMRGRYFSIDTAISYAGTPVGIVAGAIIINSYGITGDYALIGVAIILTSLVFLIPGTLRKFGVEP